MDNKIKLSPGQRKTQELSERRASLIAAIAVLKAKRNFIFLSVLLATFGTLLGHYFQVASYETTSTLFVQTMEEPTAAEYLLNQQVGRVTSAERIEVYMRYLKSDSFYLSIAQKLKYHDELSSMNLTPPKDKSTLKLAFWKKLFVDFVSNNKDTEKVFNAQELSTESLASFVRSVVHYDADFRHVIFIKAQTLDPRTSQILANMVSEHFVAMTNKRGISEIEQVSDFIKKKLANTQEHLKKIELELIEFKKKNNIISTDKSSDLLSERFTKVAADLESSQLKYEENLLLLKFFTKGQRASLNDSSKGSRGKSFGIKETTFLLQKKIQQLKKKKSVIIAQADPNQEYRLEQINKEIEHTTSVFKKYIQVARNGNIFAYMNPNKLQQKIQELKEENEILKRKISTHKRVVSSIQVKIQKIPKLAQKQFVLENNLKLEIENYSSLKTKLSELEIQTISHKKEIRIDQVAQFPMAVPRGSLPLKLLFSFLISLFFGTSIIIGIETLDPTIKHRVDLQDCGLDFIGDIPLLPDDDNQKIRKSTDSVRELVCLSHPESLEAMAFKYIRARVESSRYKFKKEHQVISVSSSSANEGKSFVVANLAVSISQLKRSVLLIDCDLRRPSQNAFFEVSPKYGLVDLLNMKKQLPEVVMKNVIPNMDYLPAGFCSELSTEYISSEKFRALISFLSKEYDYLIIDTPPTFAAVDASIIASYSDFPILISSFRETKKSELHDAYNQLLQVSYKKVYGIINKAIISTSRFHYYGYHTQLGLDKENVSPLTSYEENPSEVKEFLDNLNKKTS